MKESEMACYLLEAEYIRSQGREVKLLSRENNDLFPLNWYATNNFEVKTKILQEAIEKKCKITETKSYAEIVEGVKLDDETSGEAGKKKGKKQIEEER